ncbi:hypothetical protein AB0F81_43760 [Actinoplanes sp. NPDC024001]|uniref:hypothetical protein n=1 Tax=Actinoplanes sp. NPDC024001 TaxID=3154598 RepID=UPI0033D5109F
MITSHRSPVAGTAFDGDAVDCVSPRAAFGSGAATCMTRCQAAAGGAVACAERSPAAPKETQP